MPSDDRLLLLARGQYSELERALNAIHSKTSVDYIDAARMYLALGEPERAARALGEAREQLVDHDDADACRVVEALDHLAHGSPEAASQVLEPLLATPATSSKPLLVLEALIIAAQADLRCDRAFRASRLAERAIDDPHIAATPNLQGRALLVLGLSNAVRGRRDRVEPALRKAFDLAARHDLLELHIDVASCLASHLQQRANSEPARADEHRTNAEELVRSCTQTIEKIASTLDSDRRQNYLSHRQQIANVSLGNLQDKPGQLDSVRRFVGTLSEISTIINSMTDLDALLERVMDLAIEIVGAERGLVVLFEPDGAHPTVAVARNLDGQTVVDSTSISHRAVREAAAGREVVAFDTAADPILSPQQSVSVYSIRSLLCFPLRIRDLILGAVYLDNQKNIRVYSTDDLEFLRAFTNLAAIAIENSRLLGRLQEENVYLKRVAGLRFDRDNIVGSGPAMERVFRLMEKAMISSFPVLITGDTGTGKEVITRAIHFGSPRRDRALVAQNCAAIPAELLESEMFGHRRGAFTGAAQDKKGLFEGANGGTLFLDEIGDLAMPLQAKLLRVLQDGKIRRIGETFERSVDVRIISATNRNLKTLVEQEKFRLDLYYRLNVIQIDLPPLRERREDIPLLAQYFLSKACKEMNKELTGFTRRAVDQLRQYAWPGNVRELENVVARAVVFCEAQVVDCEDLPPMFNDAQTTATDTSSTPADSTHGLAHRLYQQIQLGQGDFWKIVKRPFLARDLSRDVVKGVVHLGLDASGWKYTRALSALGLPADDYRRFMNFLAKFNLKVDRPATPE